MKKDLFEVTIETVDVNDGRHKGYAHIGWFTDGDRAEQIARDYANDVAQNMPYWWMQYGRDVNDRNIPEVKVTYMGELMVD